MGQWYWEGPHTPVYLHCKAHLQGTGEGSEGGVGVGEVRGREGEGKVGEREGRGREEWREETR